MIEFLNSFPYLILKYITLQGLFKGVRDGIK
jgi:hypothetical protein